MSPLHGTDFPRCAPTGGPARHGFASDLLLLTLLLLLLLLAVVMVVFLHVVATNAVYNFC